MVQFSVGRLQYPAGCLSVFGCSACLFQCFALLLVLFQCSADWFKFCDNNLSVPCCLCLSFVLNAFQCSSGAVSAF